MSLQLRITPIQLPSGSYMWSIVDVEDCTWSPTDGPATILSTQEMLDLMQTNADCRTWSPNPSAAKTIDVGFAPSLLRAGIEGAQRLETLDRKGFEPLPDPPWEPSETTWAVMFTGDEEENPGVCYEENQPLIFVGEEAEKQATQALVQFLERWHTPAENQGKFVARPVKSVVA